MADGKASQQREGLSLQTLILAAVSSAVAAIVVSHFWRGGTVIASAMTPVIVALVKEGLARPMQSDLVRRPVRRVSEVSARTVLSGVPAQRTERARTAEPAATRPAALPDFVPPPPPPPRRALGVDEDGLTPEGLTPGDVLLSHPRRTYRPARGGRRRALRLKLAIVTGVLAFAIAVAALTLPELVFGGAVASHHSTTFFGGGSHSKKKQAPSDQNNSKQQTTQQQTTPQSTQTTPQSTTPQSTTPQAPPPGGQTTPSQPAPVPAPSSPPPSGGSAPSSP